MRNQAIEVYSRRLNELIEKLQQAGLGADEVLKIVKALIESEGPKDIESWFNRARDKAFRARDVLGGSVFVLFIGIMTMIASSNGIPDRRRGPECTCQLHCSSNMLHPVGTLLPEKGQLDRS